MTQWHIGFLFGLHTREKELNISKLTVIMIISRMGGCMNAIVGHELLLPPFSENRLRHFERYVASSGVAFRRADQASRFRAYLRGLLESVPRKNVESIALAASRALDAGSDLIQALQHFVSQSPWECRSLRSVMLNLNRGRRHDPNAVWVVHDAAFAKKGRHSVGVLRQFARDYGKKINCQVAVFIAQIGPRGYFPLAARLYLPAAWLNANANLAAAGIPPEAHRFASKGEIALTLLDELRELGETPRPVVVEKGYLGTSDFVQGLEGRGLTSVADLNHWIDQSIERTAWLRSQLGLDHFEGRTWLGWHHHVTLVFAAYDLLAAEQLSSELPPFPTRE